MFRALGPILKPLGIVSDDLPFPELNEVSPAPPPSPVGKHVAIALLPGSSAHNRTIYIKPTIPRERLIYWTRITSSNSHPFPILTVKLSKTICILARCLLSEHKLARTYRCCKCLCKFYRRFLWLKEFAFICRSNQILL